MSESANTPEKDQAKAEIEGTIRAGKDDRARTGDTDLPSGEPVRKVNHQSLTSNNKPPIGVTILFFLVAMALCMDWGRGMGWKTETENWPNFFLFVSEGLIALMAWLSHFKTWIAPTWSFVGFGLYGLLHGLAATAEGNKNYGSTMYWTGPLLIRSPGPKIRKALMRALRIFGPVPPLVQHPTATFVNKLRTCMLR